MRRIILLVSVLIFGGLGALLPGTALADVCSDQLANDIQSCDRYIEFEAGPLQAAYQSCVETAIDDADACSTAQGTPPVAQAQSCSEGFASYLTGCYELVTEQAPIRFGCNALLEFNESNCPGLAEYTSGLTAQCDEEAEFRLDRCVDAELAAQDPTTPTGSTLEELQEENAPAQRGQISTSYQQIREHGLIFAGICPGSRSSACPCRDNGDCTVANILQVFVNIMNFILAISGSIVLLMFVYGGFTWLTSQGKSGAIDRGKRAIGAAIVGTLIIFGAYSIITFVVTIILPDQELGQDLEDLVGGEDFFDTQNE